MMIIRDDVYDRWSLQGQSLQDLDDNLMREMGFTVVGTRRRVLQKTRALVKKAAMIWRRETIWEGNEHRAPCCLCLPYGSPCCCTCCIGFPAAYRLSNSRLSVISRDGLCMGLCAPLIITDNLDLGLVTDIDIVTYTPCLAQCCCGCFGRFADQRVSRGQVSVSSLEGIKNLHLTKSEAATVAAKLFASVEESQLRFVSERALWASAIM